MDVSKETAEIYFNNGLYEDAMFILELVFREEAREYGLDSARTLETATRIADMYVVREKYVEALTVLLHVYRRKAKNLRLVHPSSLDTRNRIVTLLLQHGSLDLVSQVMQDIVNTFNFLAKMTRKKHQDGLHKQAMEEGRAIIRDMVIFLGIENPMTLEMGCLLAEISTTTEQYSKPLKVVEEICEKMKLILGHIDKRVACAMMTKASIHLKMEDFDVAKRCYQDAYATLELAVGTGHKKTFECLRRMAEVMYTMGDYEKAFGLLKNIATCQKLLKHKEIPLTKLHIGILQYSRGNYKDALSVLSNILIARTPKRIRAMIQHAKGTTLAELGRYNEAKIALKNACDIMKRTHLYTEALIMYRNYAALLAKQGNVAMAEKILLTLIASAVVGLNPRHSVVFSIENELAELWLFRGRLNEALRIFVKIWTFRSESLGKYHPATLRAKCQVAKVFTEQGKYNEALRMYNEVLPVLKVHYYYQHLDVLDVQNRIAYIYICRCSFASAFDMYFKVYTILRCCYEPHHPFWVEVIERMDSIADCVPVRRVIEAAINEDMDDLVVLINNKEDVNVRDVNGAAALHYLSKRGNVHIIRYLLNKGAIYDPLDLQGFTPEDMSANDETRRIFLLVQSLFEYIETCDLLKITQVLQRERSIINARNCEGRTPLIKAVEKERLNIVNELLNQGADLSLCSEEDGNVLHVAARNEQVDILEMLIQRMRSIYGVEFRVFLNSPDNVLGMTPLHCAASSNRRECVQKLMFHLANPFITDALGKRASEVGNPEINRFISEYSSRFYNTYAPYLREQARQGTLSRI